MLFVVWIGVCVALSAMWIAKPDRIVFLAVSLYVCLPFVAHVLVRDTPHGIPSANAASWLLLSYSVLFFPYSVYERHLASTSASRALFPYPARLLLLLAILGAATFDNLNAGHSLGLFLDEVLAPVFLCFLCLASSRYNPHFLDRCCRLILGLGVFEGLLALAVRVHMIQQPFQSALSTNYWYATIGSRQMGTLDHPLALAAFLVVCVPLVANIKRDILRSAVWAVLLLGILVSESRAALVLAIAGIVLPLLRRDSVSRRLRTLGVLILSGAAIWATGLASGVRSRFQGDQGSLHAHASALPVGWHQVGGHLLTGGGPLTASQVAASYLTGSLEQPAIMYALNYGTLVSLILFGVPLWLLIRRPAAFVGLRGARLSAILFFVDIQTFSSVADDMALGALLWVTVGLALSYRSRIPISEAATAPSAERLGVLR